MNTYTVYKHTSPSGKVYIGITTRPVSRRWHGGSAYRNNSHFYSAIKKYGWESFQHEILAEGLTREEACEMECQLIKIHQSTNPEKGYNLSPGGDKTTLGYKFSPESRARISRSLQGKRRGIPLTDAHRENIRRALKGHSCSEETRSKLRSALGDRFKTPEVQAKRRENTPKGARHPKATAVICLDTGKVYATIAEAASEYEISRSRISACCRGIQKTTGGKRWAYKEILKK